MTNKTDTCCSCFEIKNKNVRKKENCKTDTV